MIKGLWKALGGGKKMVLEHISLRFQEEDHTPLEHMVTSHAHTTGPEAVLCKPDEHKVMMIKVQVHILKTVSYLVEHRFHVSKHLWDH